MDLCHLKNSELEPQFQKYKGRVVLRGDIVKDDSGPYAVFAEQASSASQMTAAKIMVLWRTSNWYSISLFSGKIGGCSKSAQKKFLIRNVQTFGYVFRDTNGPNFGETLKIPWYLLNDTFIGHPLAGLLWLELEAAKVPNWKCMFVQRKQGLFLSEYVDDIKTAGKKQNMAPMWKKLMKNVDLEEPRHFLIT